MADTRDLENMTGDLLRLGRVASVDLAAHSCTVETGDITTGPLPWFTPRAGALRVWSPPTVGEQCLLLCAEGDTENGLVLLGLYSDAFPPPSDLAGLFLLEFDDGTRIAYDRDAGELDITLAGAGKAKIVAPGGLAIEGDVTVTGKITASEDVLGGGISLKSHKHSGVAAGGAQSGGPV